MTPEERAETLENIKRAVAESPNSIFGIGQYEFEASDITAAIRETEAAVHAQYEHLIEAASSFVRAEETDIYYRWRKSSDKAIESAANGIEKELARLGRSARANLKGK